MQMPAESQQTCCKPEGKHELSQAHGCSQLEVLRGATSLACSTISQCLVAASHCDFGVQDPLVHLRNVFLGQDRLEGVVLGLYEGSSNEELATQRALGYVTTTAALVQPNTLKQGDVLLVRKHNTCCKVGYINLRVELVLWLSSLSSLATSAGNR